MFRLAVEDDIPAIVKIYDDILLEQDKGNLTVGWVAGVYPVEATAREALARNDLYAHEDSGNVLASAVINHTQADEYKFGDWRVDAEGEETLVMHTLSVSPSASGRGIGSRFLDFYERMAREKGCKSLRIDTNEKNMAARQFYARRGFSPVGVVPCSFNGIHGVRLLLLEKAL